MVRAIGRDRMGDERSWRMRRATNAFAMSRRGKSDGSRSQGRWPTMARAMVRDRERDGRPWQSAIVVIARAMADHGKSDGS
jgi:hypothetical protein